MALQDVIDVFATGTYTITRPGTGSYVEGVWVPASTTTISDVVASVQPAEGETLIPDSEGRSHVAQWVIYTKVQLKWKDTLTIQGQTCMVIKVSQWNAFGGTHYVSYAATQAIP